MAVFNIKRGDSVPPLVISMRVSGSDPEEFWDANKDDINGTQEDNGLTLGTPIVVFTMTNLTTGEIVGPSDNAPITGERSGKSYTGLGEIIERIIGYEDPPDNTVPIKKTLLRYNWTPPKTAYDPSSPDDTDPEQYGGDTAKAGVYKGEFELYYNTSEAGYTKKRRTFPSSPQDQLIINVLVDDNDKRSDETE